MTTFLKLLGSAIGSVVGFLALVAMRGMLAPLLSEGSVLVIAIVLGIVGLSVGTVIQSAERESGPAGFLKTNLFGICFLCMMAVAVILTMGATSMIKGGSFAEPLTMSWLGVFRLGRAILFVACGASTGYFLGGKLAARPRISE